MSILNTSDFIGIWNVSLDTATESILSSLITYHEERYLRDLLGDDLYDSFISGLAEVSVKQKWIDLRDGKTYKIVDSAISDRDNDILNVRFRGVKEMLKFFIWSEFQWKNRQLTFSSGIAIPKGNNATIISNQEFNANVEIMYNEGVKIYNSTNEFILEMNNYVDIISISGTLVTTNRTKYLISGDNVEINNAEYTVGTVISDTSFTTNITPFGSSWVKIFYENYKFTNKDYLILGGVV